MNFEAFDIVSEAVEALQGNTSEWGLEGQGGWSKLKQREMKSGMGLGREGNLTS